MRPSTAPVWWLAPSGIGGMYISVPESSLLADGLGLMADASPNENSGGEAVEAGAGAAAAAAAVVVALPLLPLLLVSMLGCRGGCDDMGR